MEFRKQGLRFRVRGVSFMRCCLVNQGMVSGCDVACASPCCITTTTTTQTATSVTETTTMSTVTATETSVTVTNTATTVTHTETATTATHTETTSMTATMTTATATGTPAQSEVNPGRIPKPRNPDIEIVHQALSGEPQTEIPPPGPSRPRRR